ncbi:MAG: hypothetical protein ACRDRA_11540 [Pseudonocardiaceae bacterium]
MAIIPEQLRVEMGTGNASVQLLHKFVRVFPEPLFLVAAFILAGVLAATSALASTHNFASSTSALDLPSCNGDTPGFCPDGPFVNV